MKRLLYNTVVISAEWTDKAVDGKNFTVALQLTVFLFSIIWHWNETMMSNSFFSTGNKTLAVAVQNASDENTVAGIVATGLYEEVGRNLQARQGTAYAAMLLFIIPPLILYIFTQKYFVEGVESSGIKG
ncbi:MAG TPA: hypothetical protein DCZ91_02680 [Lachnospiraceae bacterium]|nr:hypothetical protein [Lachnospiraceae bacterium]